ncbi:MAG: hypothetical protein JW940_11395 [Polyangiaceae bacterium]|nr:hypothetical protein [Polyangiaceae bacterium]
MRNAARNGTTLSEALVAVRRRLPPGWGLETQAPNQITLRGADGRTANVSVLVRTGLVPRDIPALVAWAERPMLVVASYLGRRARELLGRAGVSYADATGNLRLAISSPAIFLEGVGADQDPNRTPRPLHSLRGAAAARVVRALCEFAPPFGVRTLAQAASTSLGSAARVVSFLETEALLARDEGRKILSVDCAALLTRWAEDYDVASTNVMRPYLESHGLDALWPKLSRLPRYAVTGSVVAESGVPTRLAMVYVDDPAAVARTLDLATTDGRANVWLLQPYDDVVFERTRPMRVAVGDAAIDLVAVSLPQTVVDLMTSPGGGTHEAEQLLEQMKQSSDEWCPGTPVSSRAALAKRPRARAPASRMAQPLRRLARYLQDDSSLFGSARGHAQVPRRRP